MNINTKHIKHNSDCSLWFHTDGLYICDCGALMNARYHCSSELSDDEFEMIILHEVQIDSLKPDDYPKGEMPKDNIYTSGKTEASNERSEIDEKFLETLFGYITEYKLNEEKGEEN